MLATDWSENDEFEHSWVPSKTGIIGETKGISIQIQPLVDCAFVSGGLINTGCNKGVESDVVIILPELDSHLIRSESGGRGIGLFW